MAWGYFVFLIITVFSNWQSKFLKNVLMSMWAVVHTGCGWRGGGPCGGPGQRTELLEGQRVDTSHGDRQGFGPSSLLPASRPLQGGDSGPPLLADSRGPWPDLGHSLPVVQGLVTVATRLSGIGAGHPNAPWRPPCSGQALTRAGSVCAVISEDVVVARESALHASP